MAAASATESVELVPQYELLDLSALPKGLSEPTETIKALAAASGGLVHDVRQILVYAHYFVCPHPGASILWLQTRPKYGALKTAVISREVASGASLPSDLARRAMRLLDPRPGAYCLKAPGKAAKSEVDGDGMISVDLKTAVLYCTTNPRSERAAASYAVSEFNARVTEEARRLAAAAAKGKAGGVDGPQIHRLDKRFLAALQREESTDGKAVFRTLDVDDKDAVPRCMTLLDEAGVAVSFAVETRGGVHLMIEPAAIGKALKSLRPLLAELRTTVVTADGRTEEHEAVEVKMDCGCPLPGTLQGGFPVSFIDPERLPRSKA